MTRGLRIVFIVCSDLHFCVVFLFFVSFSFFCMGVFCFSHFFCTQSYLHFLFCFCFCGGYFCFFLFLFFAFVFVFCFCFCFLVMLFVWSFFFLHTILAKLDIVLCRSQDPFLMGCNSSEEYTASVFLGKMFDFFRFTVT